MATAEKLLHEAQYAYQNISFGESRDNRRSRSRATRLAKKIIRKYPVSMEAGEARALLRRLGEEGYSFKTTRNLHTHRLPDAPGEMQHSHRPQQAAVTYTRRSEKQHSANEPQGDALDLGRLIIWLFTLPRVVQIVLIFAGVFLFSILGPLLLFPLALIIILATPLRQYAPAEMRREVDSFIRSVNEWIADSEGRNR
jgi:hypothetical protein